MFTKGNFQNGKLEIHKNQKSSILVSKLKELFEKYYKDHKDEMLNEVKQSWDFKRGLIQDLMAHKEHLDEVLPRIALFKQGAKEIMEDKTGINNMSAGNRDETEDMKVRAELMKNAVTIKEMDILKYKPTARFQNNYLKDAN